MKLTIHLCVQIPTSTYGFHSPSFIGWVEKPRGEFDPPWELPKGYLRLAAIETEAMLDWPAITARAVQALEERKRKVRGEAEAIVTELEGTIQSFLALGAPE